MMMSHLVRTVALYTTVVPTNIIAPSYALHFDNCIVSASTYAHCLKLQQDVPDEAAASLRVVASA
eukprot:11561-Heterococcus_DN1.PRE.2